jgi:hypothetical protein
MAISAEDRRRYARVQAQVEAIIEEIAAADAFIFASRDPNTGRSAATSWERDSSWKRDIRDDLTRGLAWLDARYGTPALTLERLQSPERNGVGIGTEPYRAVCAGLSRLAKD